MFYPDIFFLSSRRKKKTTKKKNYAKKGRELTFKLLFCPFTFGSRFYLLIFALLFQVLSFSIFFFSSKKKKNNAEKKTHREEKNANRGRSLLSSFRFALSFMAPTSALLFQVFSPNIFFFSNKQKKKHNEKKNHREEKNAQKGRNLPLFKQKKRKKNIKKGRSLPLVKQKKKKKKKNHKEKKIIEKKKKCREGNLLSLLHLGWSTPLVFSSSDSFNVELSTFLKPCVYISSKLYATQAHELFKALEMEWAGNEVREVGGRRAEVGRREGSR